MANDFTIIGTSVSSPGTAIEQELALALQPNSEPTLTTSELSLILSLSSIPDDNGLSPDDTSWTPTYDINSAIVRGWKTKAAKVAGNYTFKDETLQLNREQIIKHCLQMAEMAAKSGGGIISTPVENVLLRKIYLETQIAMPDLD